MAVATTSEAGRVVASNAQAHRAQQALERRLAAQAELDAQRAAYAPVDTTTPLLGKVIVFAVTKRHAETLAQLLDRRYFATIELDAKSRLDELPDVRAALKRNYKIGHVGADGVMLDRASPAL